MRVVRYADRPDLHARRYAALVGITFPTYMNHNEPGELYWDRLYSVGLGRGLRARHDVGRASDGSDGYRDQRRAGSAGRQLSSRMIQTFTDNARAAGLTSVIAPVRPTWKERYPLIPIERSVEWRRDDGSHFDPWIRIHEVVGGEILAPAPTSMTIRAPALDWEEWVGMRFPDDGEYVFPRGLAMLTVQDGIGTHVEPNV